MKIVVDTNLVFSAIRC